MAHHDESSLNVHLADILSGMAPESGIRAENTGVVRESRGLKPDILITAPGRSPVIIEAEYEPANSVEQEAKQRLGLELEKQTRPVEAVVALRYPKPLEHADNIEAELNNARLSYCFFQDSGREGGQSAIDDAVRFPETGWLEGSINDLSDLIRMISIPQKEVDRAAEILRNGIEQAAVVLDSEAKERPGFSADIAFLLGMEDGKQTRRMACAIAANAMIFHERIAGMHDDEIRIDPLRRVCAGDDPLERLTSAWKAILDYNYFPIFSIANDILDRLPTAGASSILYALRSAASQVESAGILYAHDLTGRIFQRLIADRKYLATFYTRPYSAALLARIAVSKLRGVNWKDRDSIEQLKIADFACGTGALLSAVYDQISARHERAGGNLDELHPAMMKEVLYGFDVMPSAVHITAATLAGARPSVKLENSRLYTSPYGWLEEDKIASIGSLELLDKEQTFAMFNASDPGKRTGILGEETATRIYEDVQDESFDLVIMNPPFTRAGSDWEGVQRKDDYVKQFRGLNTTLDTQKKMADLLKQYSKGTCYHGFAGLGSAFAALVDKKLKPGGVLAMVLPLTAASGQSWLKFRQMLAQRYVEIDVLSIAGAGHNMSFSADTGMAECLVIARKHESASSAETHETVSARFTCLQKSPSNFVEAAILADQIVNADARRIEEGPYGGAPILIGDEQAGEAIASNVNTDAEKWGAVRIADYSVAQTAYALARSKLRLPGYSKDHDLPVVPLGQLAERSPHAMNIANSSVAPFDIKTGRPSRTATYPALWSHNAQNEKRMICEPDCELQMRRDMKKKADRILATISRCHYNAEFTFGAQPLAVAFTERESVGGRVWPNVKFKDKRFDYAFAIWGNCALGLLMYWWHSSRQQSSKGRISVALLLSLPTLDLRALSDDQLSIAERIFNDFRGVEFKPAYIADLDSSRAALDRAVVCELLGFDEAVYEAVRGLSAKWAAEPSVRGSKRRPAGSLAV